MWSKTTHTTLALAYLLGSSILFLNLPFTALADPASPATLATACFTCHGTDGKSPGAIPSLHGKTAAYIEQKLQAFKTDRQQVTLMNRIAKGYSDREIASIAKFLGRK